MDGSQLAEKADASAEEAKENEFGISLKLGYARLAGQNGRVAFGLEAQRAFSDGKRKAQLCEAIEDTEMLESCKELPFGPPVEKEALIARFEYRHYSNNLITSPVIAFDFESDVWGFELPLYYLRDSDKNSLVEYELAGVRTRISP